MIRERDGIPVGVVFLAEPAPTSVGQAIFFEKVLECVAHEPAGMAIVRIGFYSGVDDERSRPRGSGQDRLAVAV